MSRRNLVIANLLILLFVIWLNPEGLAVGPCPPDCPTTTSTIPGTVNCNSNLSPLWDYENTGSDTIAVNDSVTIAVKWGRPPYTWTLFSTSEQGRGFSLAETTTMEPTNTLSTNSAPCGTAWIRVTDACGNDVFETIRHPESGTWVSLAQNKCSLSERWNEKDDLGKRVFYAYRYGGRYQEQVIVKGPGTWGYCPGDETCGGFASQPHHLVDCLLTGRLPCKQYSVPLMYECIKTLSMSYQEWECIN